MRTLVVMLGIAWPLVAADVREHPQYKTWVLHLQDGPDDKRMAAATALQRYGKAALPALAALRVALGKVENPATLERVVETIGAIGPEAREAVPEIVKLLEQERLRGGVAVLACKHLGEPANTALLRTCLQRGLNDGADPSTDDDLPILINVAPADALPALVAIAADAKPNVRTYLLGCILSGIVEIECERASNERRFDPERFALLKGQVRNTVLAYARSFLTDADAKARYTACNILLAITPECVADVFPIFFKTLLSDAEVPREVARSILPATCLPWLLVFAGDHSEDVRKVANRTLTQLVNQDALGCLPYFRVGLGHRNLRVVEATIEWLRLHSDWAEELWPSLAALLDHPNARVRFVAADCLITSDAPFTPRYLPILREQLASPGNGEQHTTLRLIEYLGPRAYALRPNVLRLFKQDFVPNQSAHTLARIDPSAAATYLPVFAKILEEAKGGPPYEVLETLKLVGPQAKPLLPMLRATLKQTKADETRWRLAETLAHIDPDNATDVVQLLRESVENASPAYIYEPLTAIRDLGPPGRVLVSWLLERMRAESKSPVKSAYVAAAIVLDEVKAAEAINVMRAGINGKTPSDWLDEAAALGAQGKQFVPDIIKQLKSKRDDHLDYIEALRTLGANASDALPTLRAFQKDQGLRDAATRAIRHIERMQGGRP